MEHDVQGDPAYGYTAHLDGVSFDAARAREADARLRNAIEQIRAGAGTGTQS